MQLMRRILKIDDGLRINAATGVDFLMAMVAERKISGWSFDSVGVRMVRQWRIGIRG